MKFPRTEAGTIVLVQQVIAGLTANPTLNDAAPFKDAALQTRLDAFLAKRDTAVQKAAEAQMATGDKSAEFDALTEEVKSDLRYLENKTQGNHAILQGFGWGARSAAQSLQAPGQPRTLEAPTQGDGFVFLDWKEPLEGGAVSFYRVERRELPEGSWEEAASSIPHEYTLINQPKAKELEYRVISVNKAGESAPSNTVGVVL